jgi:hypothetical protein
MVPFSFPQTLLKSRVMKEYLTGALDDGINGFWDNWVQRHAGGAWSLESALLPFPASCFPYGHFGLCENLRNKVNQASKPQ